MRIKPHDRDETQRAKPDCFHDEDLLDFINEAWTEQERRIDQTHRALWRDVMQEIPSNDQYIGVTLKQENREQWAVIMPEPYSDNSEKAFRFSVFDEGGFALHETHASAHEALVAAFNSGYVLLCSDDTLDAVSARWREKGRALTFNP